MSHVSSSSHEGGWVVCSVRNTTIVFYTVYAPHGISPAHLLTPGGGCGLLRGYENCFPSGKGERSSPLLITHNS
jgi:hypothetical protein